ncbi:disulfide bond formation protein B [Noviherbaspirillum saxi]|uniref:Disulfide bond formation protein B n=1 Tax=Noviherbaspirillum saxi TaxID=2320863 RepID=A0A3A3FHY5_9BURK|nr:disulfide bond formation protein B [Noviherbaspirillum saxi]RJF92770.1 disulfide bond formation protein B [Noviherbaspirillum saxi]
MANSVDSAKTPGWALLFACWLLATISSLGALFLGEVMGLTPCVLCWYQRICMFPLVLILAASLFPLDVKVVRYAFPLAVTGLGIAIFHLLVAQGLIAETLSPCTQGVPCSAEQIEWFGFLTIPMLSVGAFAFITALLITTQLKASK